MRSFVESSDDIVISQMMFLPSVIAPHCKTFGDVGRLFMCKVGGLHG